MTSHDVKGVACSKKLTGNCSPLILCLKETYFAHIQVHNFNFQLLLEKVYMR